MIVYIVTKEGVYRHEIIGIYTELKDAEQNAKDALRGESDAYHDFHVLSLELEKPYQGYDEYHQNIIGENLVAVYSKTRYSIEYKLDEEFWRKDLTNAI